MRRFDPKEVAEAARRLLEGEYDSSLLRILLGEADRSYNADISLCARFSLALAEGPTEKQYHVYNGLEHKPKRCILNPGRCEVVDLVRRDPEIP